MKQLSKDELIALSATRFWEKLTPRQIVDLQLAQDLICIPIDVYQNALTAVLGRPVLTHEMGNPQALRQELYGQKSAPGLGTVIDELIACMAKGRDKG